MDMVSNILSVFRQATLAHCDAGMDWYPEAYVLASDWTHGDVWKGAGVIAAYSPLTPWPRNLELARDTFKKGTPRTDTLTGNWTKAGRILAGEDALTVLNGQKTSAFCQNIVFEGKTDIVTIDSHAYSIAIGSPVSVQKMPSLGKARYAEFVEAYREAAAAEQLYPGQLQAITWVAWREGVRA